MRGGVKPKVAVITRTIDRGPFLKRAVKCVQQQSSQDYVHVVVNDGGNKEQVDKLLGEQPKEYQARLIVLHHKVAHGRTRALNEAIRRSQSQYIAVLDDDDTWDPDYLKLTTEHLDKTGAKGVVAVLDKVIEKVEDDRITLVAQERWRPDIKAVSLYGQCLDNYAPTVTFVYQREVYEELGGYDEKLNVAEDWEFTLRFLLKYDIDFLNTKKALAFYHLRPDATAAAGNTVLAGADEHRYYLNMLANHFLRKDIQEGRFGIGYIMNSLYYQREVLMRIEPDWIKEQTVRLEGHVNYATEKLSDNLVQRIKELFRTERLMPRIRNKIKKTLR